MRARTRCFILDGERPGYADFRSDWVKAMGKWVIVAGLGLVVIGFLILGVEKLGFRPGRLPGDIAVERDGFGLYIPITSMILLSLLLTLISLAVRWLRP